MSAALSSNQSDWLTEFPPPRSLPLDQEALRIYEQAYAIGLTTETTAEPPITFSTVLIALFIGADETSQWFGGEASTKGPLPGAVAAEKGLSFSKLLPVAEAGRPPTPRLSADKQLLTLSAQAVLGTAEEWANRVGASDIGVRHLVAAYVLNPPAAHRQQMNGWGFKERAWRDVFFDWIGRRYTAESWTDLSGKVSPTKAIASFERPTVKGAAVDFPGDTEAMEVLDRAARYHATRADPWLRMQTAFFALIEESRENPALQSKIAPVWQATEAAGQKYRAALAAFLGETTVSRPLLPFDAIDISPRVLNGLETARELALAAGHDGGKVGVLALAAALISRRVDGDEDLAAWGLDPQALRLAVIDHAADQGETRETWREALGEEELLPSGRILDLNSDEPEAVIRADEKWTSDPLGIRGDVTAFATLLASKSLEPPLSIGLFGPWGAGKTTFLKRLRLAIDERAAQAAGAQQSGQASPYVGHVVHVEFNAWHFAETAIISSLLDAIVRELRSFIRNDNPPVGQALAALKSETVERSRLRAEAARQAETAARDLVATTTTALQTHELEAGKKAAGLETALQLAWNSALEAAKAIPVVKESHLLDNLGDTIGSLEELKSRAEVLRGRPARMLAELGWAKTTLFAVLVLVLPAAVAWLVKVVFKFESTSQAVVSLSALLSVVLVWLRAASGTVSKLDAAIAKVAEAYQAKVQADPGVKQARADLDAAAAEAACAGESVATAEAALRQAEAELASAALPAQVLSLVSSRVEDRSYARELTTISAARADLQVLSQLLREQATNGSSVANITPVDRVILYIDDLDRCKPEDVVRVLQVVHMLLAFELFVVVVAVDARWVDESLKQTYAWLQSAKADSGSAPGSSADAPAAAEATHITPQDYLEKIFQISFWLEPMTAARAAEYLKSLIRTPRRQPVAPQPGTLLQAGRIEILPIELDYMRALAAYVGPSPRRVKRLVNAYRLLKARISDAQLDQFLTDRTADDGTLRSGPYQLVIGLLVIGTGAPASASEILTELAERDPRDRLETVIDACRARHDPDWTMAAQVLEMLMRTQKSNDISELRGWASKVGRFLLQGSTVALRQSRGEIPRPST